MDSEEAEGQAVEKVLSRYCLRLKTVTAIMTRMILKGRLALDPP